MIVIVDSPGQTCNRLWSYLDIVAWAVVNKCIVNILFWDPSIKYFNNLRDGKYSKFPLYNRYLINILGESRYLTCLYYLLDNKLLHSFYETKFAEKLGLVCGWSHRADSKWHPQVREEVIKIFRPNENICKDVESLFKVQKIDNVEIIGVHIRRGDYNTFADGRFFFSMEDYVEMIDRLSHLQKSNNQFRKFRFFLSSNESINPEFFSRIDYFMNPKGSSAIHDLYALSLCDRVIGPVSTFSMWAAWYGAKPLLQVDRVFMKNFQLKDFQIPKGFFQNW